MRLSAEFDQIAQQEARSAAARNIFNEVEDWRGTKRAIASRRWLWELLQNAKDASKGRPFSFTVSVTPDALTIRHDAGPFDLREIVALVEGDSSKHRRAEDTTGRFGKGFLVSHVVSPNVLVKGVLQHKSEGELSFTFRLQRHGNEGAVRENIMHCKNELDKATAHQGGPCFTEFKYFLAKDERTKSCILEALRDLRNHAPYLFSFIRELKQISFEVSNEPTAVFSTGSRDQIVTARVPGSLESVSVSTPDGDRTVILLTVTQPADAVGSKVAFEVAGNGRICTPRLIARVFQDLPLYATAEFDIPVVINIPGTCDIDSDRAAPNVTKPDTMKSIASALGGVPALVEWAVKEGKRGAHLLAEFGLSAKMQEEPDGCSLWEKHIAETVKKLTTCRLVESDKGYLPPTDVVFPDSEWAEIASDDKDLLHGVRKLLAARGDSVPSDDSVEEWETILTKWETLSTIVKVQRTSVKHLFDNVAAAGSLIGLGQRYPRLSGSDGAITFVRDLFVVANEYCERHKIASVADLDRTAIIPNQLGRFREGSTLKLDGGVDPILKGISKELGIPFEEKLVDRRASESPATQLIRHLCGGNVFDNRNAVAELLNNIDQKAAAMHGRSPDSHQVRSAVITLMVWFAGHEKEADHDLRSFPFACADNKLHAATEYHDSFLLPKALMLEESRPWGDIFPANIRLDDLYSERCKALKIDGQQLAKFLAGRRLASPMLLLDREVGTESEHFAAMYVTPKSEQGHRIEKVPTRDIAGLSRLLSDTAGVSSSGNDAPARQVLEFILSYAAVRDSSWKRPTKASCTARHGCPGSAAVYPCSWLGRLKSNRWVPSAERGGQCEALSSRNIHDLLEALPAAACASVEAREFLAMHFGVDRLEMAIRAVAGDDHEKIARIKNDWASIVDSGVNPEEVREYAVRHKAAVELTARNRKLGSTVESLVAAAFTQQGFQVTRTGAGSDFRVCLVEARDLESGNEDVGQFTLRTEYEGVPIEFLVEIKATTEQAVRMSWLQADTASKGADAYVLCVVDFADHEDLFARVLDDSQTTSEAILTCVRLIPTIGNRLAQSVKNLGSAVQTDTPGIEVERAEDIRFRILRAVWQDGANIHDWATAVKKQLARARAARKP